MEITLVDQQVFFAGVAIGTFLLLFILMLIAAFLVWLDH